MKIQMNVNWGAKASGVYWLLKGETYDTVVDGIPDKEATMLIGTRRAVHIGEANELFNKEQGCPARPGGTNARSNRRNKNAK